LGVLLPPPEQEGEAETANRSNKPRHHFMLNAKANTVADAKKTGFQFDFETVVLNH